MAQQQLLGSQLKYSHPEDFSRSVQQNVVSDLRAMPTIWPTKPQKMVYFALKQNAESSIPLIQDQRYRVAEQCKPMDPSSSA
jgi:hypothetical protein